MTDVDCLTCREAVSARLDGEAEPVPAEHTDEHLASCADCRAWQARVTATSRLLRVRQAPDVPDLSAAILDMAVPPSNTRGWWARIALIAVAAAQLSLALSQMLGVGAPHNAEHAGVPIADHFFNESTAWNLALGIGLLWTAFRSRATSGLIPVLGGFVLLLGIYSTYDLVTGAAPVARVIGHGLLLVGFGLLVVINRCYNDPAPQPGQSLDDTRDDLPGGPAAEADQPQPDTAAGNGKRHRHLRPAGRHRAA
ncbi:zf-HC2 domain-containing protein [Actinophytocola sp.]|uniref:zf-HC2 domain-containing protein n=1 Tax=Actinophytocola sp. TaxID=1872138 RepID=UPI002ED2F12D